MTFFTTMAANAPVSAIRGVNGTVAWGNVHGSWRSLILQIVWHNNKLAKYARRGLLQNDRSREESVAFGIPVRSSHGNVALDPPPYPDHAPPAPMTPLQSMWYWYAADAKTDACPVGHTPAYIEFTLTGGGGASRIVWDYMGNVFLVSDHYASFYEVTGVPAA